MLKTSLHWIFFWMIMPIYTDNNEPNEISTVILALKFQQHLRYDTYFLASFNTLQDFNSDLPQGSQEM